MNVNQLQVDSERQETRLLSVVDKLCLEEDAIAGPRYIVEILDRRTILN